MKIKLINYSGLFLLILCPSIVLSQNTGGLTGGSLFSSAIGSNSLTLNPANFWTSEKSGFSLMLPISIQLDNNSISSNWLNSYLLSGQKLDNLTMKNMLNDIPNTGLSINGHGHGLLFGLSYKWLALYVGGAVDFNGRISKSLFETLFQGIKFDRSIFLNDTQLGFQVYLPVSLVFSKKIGEKLFIGMGIKGLLGMAYSGVKTTGSLTSYKDRFSGNGSLKIESNLGEMYFKKDSLLSYSQMGSFSPQINGSGIALDFGMTRIIHSKWTLGLSVQNVIGKINWDEETSHNHVIEFETNINSDEFESMGDYTDTQQDSLLESIVYKDNISNIDTLTTTIPIRIELESEYILGNRFLIFNTMAYQGESTILPDSQIEFSSGFRWLMHRRIPITFGLTHNSLWGLKWGGGIGFHINHFHCDLLVSQNGGFINEAKGLNFNLINYFYF